MGRPLQEQMQVFSPQHSDELYRVYREWNHANTSALLLAYPGVEEAVRELRDAGRRLGIVTSKSRDAVNLAWGVLPRLGELFDVVIAADDTARHKPDAAPVLEALARLGGTPSRACYVGDAPFDIRRPRGGRGHPRRDLGVLHPPRPRGRGARPGRRDARGALSVCLGRG